MDAGGWQHDTLTEDLDLSYRAQLKGWKFLFLPATRVPAELPPEIQAFKAQQYRWTKGGAQTCKKLLPTILRSPLSWKIKVEAFFHLTSNVVYFFVVLLSLLLFPVLFIKLHFFSDHLFIRILFDMSLLAIATVSASTFYVCSQREIHKSWWQSLKYLPAIMSLGVGIAINNALAMCHGFWGPPSEFVRTPKYGVEPQNNQYVQELRPYTMAHKTHIQAWFELAMGIYLICCVVLLLSAKSFSLGIPFLFLFACGYLYVALSTLLAPWLQKLNTRHMNIKTVSSN